MSSSVAIFLCIFDKNHCWKKAGCHILCLSTSINFDVKIVHFCGEKWSKTVANVAQCVSCSKGFQDRRFLGGIPGKMRTEWTEMCKVAGFWGRMDLLPDGDWRLRWGGQTLSDSPTDNVTRSDLTPAKICWWICFRPTKFNIEKGERMPPVHWGRLPFFAEKSKPCSCLPFRDGVQNPKKS